MFCVLLLPTTCYCCIIHQLLWFMYRDIFTVGVVLIKGNGFDSNEALNDYTHITTSGGSNLLLARCVTGLGPNGSGSFANGVLGGWYFNGTKITNDPQYSSTGPIIQSIPEASVAGVINLYQFGNFIAAAEGVYTCTMMNSSMKDQSVRLGVYLIGRSE